MRRLLLFGCMAGFLLLGVWIKAQAQRGGQGNGQGDGNQGDGGESQIQRGFQIAPVQLNLSGKNPSLVGLGSYFVNGPGDCVGCHATPITNPPTPSPFTPNGNPFVGQPAVVNQAGYLAGGTAFGPFISRNLTPDKTGKPAGLTLEQFKLTIRTGVDLKAIPPDVPSAPGFLQVMPWPQFRHATDRDLEAIYEYLRAIPCKEGGPGQAPNRC
jgi:hypothetical protein